MRIAIVFSSPNDGTQEFENVWKKCPDSRKLGQDKLVIEGGDWKIFAFNGLSRAYFTGTWNLETIQSEVKHILETHTPQAVGFFLHGSEEELSLLAEQLQMPSVQEIFYKWYTSSVGTFFEKKIRPFSNQGSDENFEKLWAKLEKTRDENRDDFDFEGRLSFVSHRLTGLIRAMRMILEDAVDDITMMREFENFDFEFLARELENIAHHKPEITDAAETLRDMQHKIADISERQSYTPKDINVGYACLEKIETLKDVLRQIREDIHG